MNTVPVQLTGNKSLDHFNTWWLINKNTLMEDDAVGIRELAHAAFCAGIDFANGFEYEKHPGEWESLNRPGTES